MTRLLLVIACLGALPACKGSSTEATGGKRSKVAAFPVEVMTVAAQPHEVVITAPGVVDAFEQIQITARVSGVVDRVAFAEGQEIKRGQTLVFVDSRRYALAVSSAQAALAKAEAMALDSAANLRRRENASKTSPGLIPGEELETYRTKLQTAKADVLSAREALKLSRVNLDDSSVKAPAVGIVQTRSVMTGQYVQAGAVLGTLLRRDPMLLRFHSSTAEAPRLKVGMPVEFKVKEARRAYKARITLVAGAAEAESRLVPITAQVEEEPGRKRFFLRPGSFAEVKVALPAQKLLPLIPQTATRPSDRGFLAYVIEGEVAHERVLQLGLHTAEGWVEVTEGLKAGEVLVTRGLEALAEGVKVRVVKPGGGKSEGKAAEDKKAGTEQAGGAEDRQGRKSKKAAPAQP
jgi:membrane fusion protein, multidrug efflux system